MGTTEWSHISYCGLCCFQVEVLCAQHMTEKGDFYFLNESRRAEVERSLGSQEAERAYLCLDSAEGWATANPDMGLISESLGGWETSGQMRKHSAAVQSMSHTKLCSYPIFATYS